jgi:hypothetical protein
MLILSAQHLDSLSKLLIMKGKLLNAASPLCWRFLRRYKLNICTSTSRPGLMLLLTSPGDVGGQKTLRSYWRNYFEKTDALIWVVDATDRLRIDDCREELHGLLQEEVWLANRSLRSCDWPVLQRLSGASLLVFANKTDVNGCMDEVEIQEVWYYGRRYAAALTECRDCSWMLLRRISGISFDAVRSQVQIFKKALHGWYKMPKQDYFCTRVIVHWCWDALVSTFYWRWAIAGNRVLQLNIAA